MASDRFAKDLATGTYDLILLNVLRDEPAYAYEIIRRIFEQSQQTIRWHQGTVYHALHHLERQGLVTRVWQGRDGSPPTPVLSAHRTRPPGVETPPRAMAQFLSDSRRTVGRPLKSLRASGGARYHCSLL